MLIANRYQLLEKLWEGGVVGLRQPTADSLRAKDGLPAEAPQGSKERRLAVRQGFEPWVEL